MDLLTAVCVDLLTAVVCCSSSTQHLAEAGKWLGTAASLVTNMPRCAPTVLCCSHCVTQAPTKMLTSSFNDFELRVPAAISAIGQVCACVLVCEFGQ